MEILYISDSVSTRKKEQLLKVQKKQFLQPQQKFHYQIIRGLASIPGINVTCLSSYCISASTSDEKFFPEEVEIINNQLTYWYINQKNGKFSHYTSIMNNCPSYINKWLKETTGKERAVIVDVLNYLMVARSFNVLRRNKVRIIGFITDLPNQTTTAHNRSVGVLHRYLGSILSTMKMRSLRKYDAFIPVSETINANINVWGKPYIVIEGSVDSDIEYDAPKQKTPRVVLYAGGVFEMYGLGNLIHAFGRLNTTDELHIYGAGTFVQDIEKYSKTHPNIKYKGVVGIKEIYDIEKDATLLVNPRPSKELFAICSFPSKIHEYMSTGRPMLLTRLRGIPDEYYQYCYVIEREDEEGIYEALKDVLSRPEDELVKKGRDAFEFVKNEKTNHSQANKIIDFIKTLNCKAVRNF